MFIFVSTYCKYIIGRECRIHGRIVRKAYGKRLWMRTHLFYPQNSGK